MAVNRRNGSGSGAKENVPRKAQGWNQVRAKQEPEAKESLATYFTEHDFLVKHGENSTTDELETATSIYVAPGTTPNIVVKHCLEMIERHWDDRGPFNIKWFTGCSLVAATLRNFRVSNYTLRGGAELFLFPGNVDPDLESVCGKAAADYVENNFRWSFSSLFLGSHSFALETGTAYFHFPHEISFQRACALLPGDEKYLFLDASKFKQDGGPGYTVQELFSNCRIVTIYTVASKNEEYIVDGYRSLGDTLGFEDKEPEPGEKALRLCIVGEKDRNLVMSGDLDVRSDDSASRHESNRVRRATSASLKNR